MMRIKRAKQEVSRADVIKMGKWLKRRREAIGMSRATLAAKIGTTYDSIRLYETGKQTMRFDRLCDLLNALGLDIATFFPDAMR